MAVYSVAASKPILSEAASQTLTDNKFKPDSMLSLDSYVISLGYWGEILVAAIPTHAQDLLIQHIPWDEQNSSPKILIVSALYPWCMIYSLSYFSKNISTLSCIFTFCVEVLIIRYDKMVSHMMPLNIYFIATWGCVCYDWLEYHRRVWNDRVMLLTHCITPPTQARILRAVWWWLSAGCTEIGPKSKIVTNA